MTKLAVLQPGYLPWLGFFNQMQRADIFVYYDDVQYDKNGWRNRNRLKVRGGSVWVTVPVLQKNLSKQRIMDVMINNQVNWGRKHIQSIRQLYAKAPFLDLYLPELDRILSTSWLRLIDLNITLSETMRGWLGIDCETYRASELGIPGSRNERLLNLCKHFDADHYLTGDSARNYLDVNLFLKHQIKVEWQAYQHPVYHQQHAEFVAYLSALDLLLNMGPESSRILAGSESGHWENAT